MSAENKVTINKRLQAEKENPLLKLEKLVNSNHFLERQIGFCSQWCLDNLCKFSEFFKARVVELLENQITNICNFSFGGW